MKKFLLSFLAFSAIVVVIVVALGVVRYIQTKQISWKLPAEKYILVMGASQPYRGFDDALTPEAVNLSLSSERYMYTYIKLTRLVENNPQIDTLILECATTDLQVNTDWKYFASNEQSYFVSNFWPFYTSEQWSIFRNQPRQLSTMVLQGLCKGETFLPSKCTSTIMGKYMGAKDNLKSFDTTAVSPPAVGFDYPAGHDVNYRYLRRIINYCRDHDVKLFLVSFPVWHPERIYDLHYNDSIRLALFSDATFIDMSRWPCSLSERYDTYHLNHHGAQRFTPELMERIRIK